MHKNLEEKKNACHTAKKIKPDKHQKDWQLQKTNMDQHPNSFLSPYQLVSSTQKQPRVDFNISITRIEIIANGKRIVKISYLQPQRGIFWIYK